MDCLKHGGGGVIDGTETFIPLKCVKSKQEEETITSGGHKGNNNERRAEKGHVASLACSSISVTERLGVAPGNNVST